MQCEKIGRADTFALVWSFLRCVIATLAILVCPSGKASLIDAQFKLTKLAPARKSGSGNEVAMLYRNVLAKSVYSKCRWLPSDSQYLTIVSQRCGRARGTFLAFARFMTEHDADKISEGAVNDGGHIRFLNFRNSCEFF